jgi:phage replication O-like protein O
MANPQLGNGYLRIAHEVWEHLMHGGFSGSELALVMAVIRQTWGWKKKSAEISLAEFQELTGQPERTAARVLSMLLSKNVLLYTKGGGRGVKSEWRFNKDWEKWNSLSSARENEKPQTLSVSRENKNSAKINSVLNGSQTLPSVTEFTAKNGRVSGCNLFPGLEHASPIYIFKERKDIQGSSTPARRDEAYDFFAAAFEQKTGTPYLKCKGDFPQLAALRRSFKISPQDTPPDWQTACLNYLESPMGSYSIAWMVTGNRYAVLRKSKVDRYGKPADGQNGNGSKPRETLEDRNMRVIRQVQMEADHGS